MFAAYKVSSVCTVLMLSLLYTHTCVAVKQTRRRRYNQLRRKVTPNSDQLRHRLTRECVLYSLLKFIHNTLIKSRVALIFKVRLATSIFIFTTNILSRFVPANVIIFLKKIVANQVIYGLLRIPLDKDQFFVSIFHYISVAVYIHFIPQLLSTSSSL